MKVCDHQGREFSSERKMCQYWEVEYNTYKYRQKVMKLPLEQCLTKKFKKQELIVNGVRFESIKELAKYCKVPYGTLRRRLHDNMDLSLATVNLNFVKTPSRDHLGNSFDSIIDMCKHWGVSYDRFKFRMDNGMPMEQCLNPNKLKNTRKQENEQ